MTSSRDSRHRAHAISAYAYKFAASLILGTVVGLILNLLVQNPRHSMWVDALLFGGIVLAVDVFGTTVVMAWRRLRGRGQLPTNVHVIQNDLLAELHRRGTRYDSGAITNPDTLQNVAGELVGLRTAIGVAHGYQADTPECHHAARRLYAAWAARKGHTDTRAKEPSAE
ncbi:hypothetical protein ACFYXD_35295 [Streptomyces platensis]|uniref:hypothetical protein n=1 Tax=Streptomyces platensis TaxID=58346 RepID=UPI0036CF4BB7